MEPLPEGPLRERVDLIERISDKLLHELHGPKMDGPRNETERVLMDINELCCDCLNGDDDFLREPLPELKGTCPVVLYFRGEADRAEFMALMQEAKPGLRVRKL